MRKTLLACCCCAVLATLAGCATTPSPTLPTDDVKTVAIDPALIQDCASIPPLLDGTASSVIASYQTLLGLYSECAVHKHSENVELKKAFNIKD